MRKLCRVDLERREALFERLARYRDLVVQELAPKAIVLFGSLARGDLHEGSDVDLLVVADFCEPFLDRITRLLALSQETRLPLEPVGYTPAEFEDMRRRGNPFLEEVLRHGHVLYGRV
ncbi:MAG: hypothetical protein KatS3mg131_0079 [Candidatus Tectimicrobiota bacterium]|nr:MAG: hypothetical protein KatS3mg131_0079 [Candidatus Tectomicrobia bacterium]